MMTVDIEKLKKMNKEEIIAFRKKFYMQIFNIPKKDEEGYKKFKELYWTIREIQATK